MPKTKKHKQTSRARRAALRARVFKRTPGPAPTGELRLHKHPMRWEVVCFNALTRRSQLFFEHPTRAAEIAATIFAPGVCIQSASKTVHGRVLDSLTFIYSRGFGIKIVGDPKPDRSESRINRRDHVLRSAPGIIAAAYAEDGPDAMWLEVATQALEGLICAIALDDPEAARQALALLAIIGMPPILTQSFLIQE